MRTGELRTTRSLSRVLVAFVLGAGSATVATGTATADVITPVTQVYDQVVYGDFNITRCPATPSPLTAAICADGAGRTDPDAVNDEYQMAWADADTSSATFNSSSASLTIPPGATVDHVRLYWAGNTGLYTDAGGLVISPLCSGNALVAGQLAVASPGTPQTQPASVRVGTGAPVSVGAQTFVSEPAEAQYYSASANITSLFSAAPTGSPLTVLVGNVWTPQGYNCFGGWSLTLVHNTTNTATAQYVPPGAPPSTAPIVSAPDSATANVYGLTLVKEVCAVFSETLCGPEGPGPWGLTANIPSGSSVYWRITATNTGDVDLTGITLTDEKESCDAEFDLAAGASSPFYCSTANVTGSVQNEATASFDMMGWPEEAVTDAVAAVSIADLHVEKEICAALTAVECATGPWVYSATVPRGATAHWRITVTNTGDVDLTGIVLDDPNEASCSAAPFDLAAHTSKTVYCSTPNVTKKTTNAVTAMYVPPGSPPDTAPVTTAPADATAMVSDLSVHKDICQSRVPGACAETGGGPWADDHVVERGGTAHWRITVTNTGEVDLTGITLEDAAEPSCSTSGIDLANGTSVSFTCSTTNVTSGMTNAVAGRYVPPGAPAGTPPVATPPDDASVRVADLTTHKEVCLTGDATTCDSWGETATVHSGETARWRVTVVNTGEVDLAEVTVQDLIEPSCAASAFALAAGAEKAVHCTTTGLTAGVVNTATATYVLPGGGSPIVTLPDSASADVSPASTPHTNPPLAVTGDDAWRLVAFGLLLVGLGLILRLCARRRT